MSRTLALAFVTALTASAASAMTPFTPRISMPSAGSPLTPAANGPVVVLDESTTTPATVAIGGRLQVRLRAQFGTGYSWALQSPPPALKSLGDQIEHPAGPPKEGGFDFQVFSFEAVSPGMARLDFVYRRPFGPQDPSARHAIFDVKVVER